MPSQAASTASSSFIAGEIGSPLGSLSLRASDAGSTGSGEPSTPVAFAASTAFFMSLAPRGGAVSFLIAMVPSEFHVQGAASIRGSDDEASGAAVARETRTG
ncbi:MAG TPA: hypothetical protein VIJ22_01575 [Polyangiaceae bacterium]